VIRPREVDHLKREIFGVVVARVSEGDRQGDPPEGDGLLAQDHSIEWVWTDLELIPGKSQSIKGVEVHEVEAAAPIHEGFGEPGRPDQRINYEGKPFGLGDTIWVIHLIKSDRGLRPMKVLRGSQTHGVNHTACKFEVTPELMGRGAGLS
jgi:hypothetical protein